MAKLVRSLLHELRLASPNGKIKDSIGVEFILEQFKKYQTTEEQLCKARDEMTYLGQTYLTYLQSSRKRDAILKDYKGKGEISTKDAASLVGFKLPHDPK